MEREQKCELCHRKAATTCGVCGSHVCAEHRKEYGCDVCGGGTTKVE